MCARGFIDEAELVADAAVAEEEDHPARYREGAFFSFLKYSEGTGEKNGGGPYTRACGKRTLAP